MKLLFGRFVLDVYSFLFGYLSQINKYLFIMGNKVPEEI